MEFEHAHSTGSGRPSLFLKSKKGGFGLVMILNLDGKPVIIRCLRLGTTSNMWIRPELVARSPTMGIMAVSCLRIMMKNIPDVPPNTDYAGEGNVMEQMEDVVHTFAAVICDKGNHRQTQLNEKKLRNYLKSIKGST